MYILYLFVIILLNAKHCDNVVLPNNSEFMGKTFQAAQLTHERFLTIGHSCKIIF
jgi:hypothetical protein